MERLLNSHFSKLEGITDVASLLQPF